MKYLLDTNVLSELRRGERADATVMSWYAEVPDEELCTSALVIGELRKGVELLRLKDPVAAAGLDGWLVRLAQGFAARVLPVDQDVAELWGRLNAPDPKPTIDGLIAATALVGGMTVVTRNVRDFTALGVPVVNPWEAQG